MAHEKDLVVLVVRCQDCEWRKMVTELAVTEAYVDVLDLTEQEHTRETLRTGRAHVWFKRTRETLPDAPLAAS